jgi:hypothetical protein
VRIRVHPQRLRKGIIDRQDYYWTDSEGQEHRLGTYATTASAKAALTRFLSPAYLAQCTGPYIKD